MGRIELICREKNGKPRSHKYPKELQFSNNIHLVDLEAALIMEYEQPLILWMDSTEEQGSEQANKYQAFQLRGIVTVQL
jgi:hypothetical protein